MTVSGKCCPRSLEKITISKKVVATIKGIFGVTVNEIEYYYLMFGCINVEDRDLIKSVTIDEIKEHKLIPSEDMLIKLRQIRSIKQE